MIFSGGTEEKYKNFSQDYITLHYITFPRSIVSQNDWGCGTSHTNTNS
jgi:hypothetical protein